MTSDASKQTDALARITRMLETFDAEILGGKTLHDVAREWLDADFDDEEEIADWLRARCFTADDARRLEDAGFTPDQSAFITSAGSRDYADTIAYKLTHGDLSFDEARRIITDEFWNK
ncbi:MAG: hypothetical protein NVSMB56_04400 [Pyrinomonadaceae bacterium]